MRRRLPPRREFARDTGLGYPVFRGWDMARVGEVVARFRPDAIVVQSTHPEALLRALAPCGVPLALYFHEVEAIKHLGSLRGTGLPILANSPFTAARLAQVCGLRCTVVLPLINAEHYRTAMQPERVLFVNTIPRKGVEVAFAVAESRPDIPFEFVLSWIHKPPALEALHARAQEAGNIVLTRPTRDMRPIYARAKLLLAPSQWEETWGRVATEAHINGIPVVGSDRGGLPMAIGSGGVIVPADAPIERWTAAVARLWDDPVAYALMAGAARRYAARPEISPETVLAPMRRVLLDAIASRPETRCA